MAQVVEEKDEANNVLDDFDVEVPQHKSVTKQTSKGLESMSAYEPIQMGQSVPSSSEVFQFFVDISRIVIFINLSPKTYFSISSSILSIGYNLDHFN